MRRTHGNNHTNWLGQISLPPNQKKANRMHTFQIQKCTSHEFNDQAFDENI